MKNIRVFEKFQFLEVKFSISLNRPVFIMKCNKVTGCEANNVDTDQSDLCLHCLHKDICHNA